MSSLVLNLRTGRLVWTVLVTVYFLTFFTNFFGEIDPGTRIFPLVFAYGFVLWLAVEYYFGSPFFQSGVVEPSALWRGVFAFFVYPYLGYLVADFVWWKRTQFPVSHYLTGVLGLLLFGLGVYIRLATLFGIVRRARAKPDGAVVFSFRRLFELKWQRVCRHPRYLAIFTILLGAALVFRSWGGLVLALILGLPLILIQVRHEERALARILRSDYPTFVRQAPLFFPRFGRSPERQD